MRNSGTHQQHTSDRDNVIRRGNSVDFSSRLKEMECSVTTKVGTRKTDRQLNGGAGECCFEDFG